MKRTMSREMVLAIAIIALATVVGLAIFHRDSGFEITIGDGDRAVSMKFKDNKVDVADILDQMLAADEANASNKELVGALLANRGYYHLADVRLINALTNLPPGEESRQISSSLRNLLYDLKGPFAETNPFVGVRNTLLVDAIMELDPRKSPRSGNVPSVDEKSVNGDSQLINPLMSELWRRSIEIQGIFRPHEIRATIHQEPDIRQGTAVACTDSLLDRKQITVTNLGRQIRVMVDARRFCGRSAPNAEMLLAGIPEMLYVGADEFVGIVGAEPATVSSTVPRDPIDVSVVVAPKHFVSLPPGVMPGQP